MLAYFHIKIKKKTLVSIFCVILTEFILAGELREYTNNIEACKFQPFGNFPQNPSKYLVATLDNLIFTAKISIQV